MGSKIYKFVGPKVAPLVLPESGGAVFRMSFPRDFNDPYELFLTIDPDEKPEFLA